MNQGWMEDGWMDEQDRWTAGIMDEWLNGFMGGWKSGWLAGWMDIQRSGAGAHTA